MTINELVLQYLNRDTGHRPREAGRFYPTDIYKIRQGYLKPCNFFKSKPVNNDEAVSLITKGIALEDFLLKVFSESKAKVLHHQKFELDCKDFIISGEMDFLLKDKVIECKYPRERCYEIPDRYIDQMTAYYMATGLDVYLCEFPFPIKLHKLVPDKKRWEENIKLLSDFNNRLKNNG